MPKSLTVVVDNPLEGFQELCQALGLSGTASAEEETDDLKKIIAATERRVIERVMRKVGGNQSLGARVLNISRGALIMKMRSYHIGDFRHHRRGERTAARAKRTDPRLAWKPPRAPIHRWTKAEVALLGKISDREVARRVGVSLSAVQGQRHYLGIPLPPRAQRDPTPERPRGRR